MKKEVGKLNDELNKKNLTREQKIDKFNKNKRKAFEKDIDSDIIKKYFRETSNNVFYSVIWPILSITTLPMGFILGTKNDYLPNRYMIDLMKNENS